MKWIIGTLSVLFAQIVAAQMVIENPVHNVLYRGYDNIVQLGSDVGDSSLTIVGGPGVSVTAQKNGKYLVRVTGDMKTATLSVNSKKGNSISRQLTASYYLRSLPAPELFWGEFANGKTVTDRSENRLIVRYPDDCLIDLPCNVISYSATASGQSKQFSGSGDRLTAALSEWLEQLPEGTSVTFLAKYVGKDKAQRTISGVFTL